MFSHRVTFSQQLNSPRLSRATDRYAQAVDDMAGARFWRRRAATKNLKDRRGEYVVELIRAAELLRLEGL